MHMQDEQGKKYEFDSSYTFKSDGSTLTGTLESGGRSIEIQNGKPRFREFFNPSRVPPVTFG